MTLVGIGACAYLMGFVVAIPVGATQLEIARRALYGFPRSALMVVAGSVLSDALYGAIAFFGVSPFLQEPAALAVFGGVNACLLTAVGLLALHGSRASPAAQGTSRKILRKRDVAFLAGFCLAITNPLMVLWWLVGVRLLREVGLIQAFGPREALLFLAGGALGIGSYLCVLTYGVYRAKHFLAERHIRWISGAFGVVLLGLALYFFLRTALFVARGGP